MALCIGFSSNVSAKVINHNFDVFIGGMNGINVSVDIDMQKTSYKFLADVTTKGITAAMYPLIASYDTMGRIEGNRFVPESFFETNKVKERVKTKKLVFNKEGAPIAKIKTRNGVEMKKPFGNPEEAVGAVDFQTAYTNLLHKYVNEDSCDGTYAVYDGKIRFDVIFNDLGDDTISKSKYSDMAGKFRKCKIFIDGKGKKSNNFLLKLGSDKPVNFWVKKTEDGTLPIVARIQAKKTGFGPVVVYLRDYEIK